MGRLRTPAGVLAMGLAMLVAAVLVALASDTPSRATTNAADGARDAPAHAEEGTIPGSTTDGSAAGADAASTGPVEGGAADRAAEPAAPEPAALRLVVNIPAYRLDVYENGERTRSYPVAVGKPSHWTPRGTYRISRAVWNPWWHPPDRPWARNASPTPPGPGNPMGRVKLYFRNLYFIHGTPQPSTLESAASHGCIRMRNRDVIELARLVHRVGSPGVSGSEIGRLIDNPSNTKTVPLERPVGLEIVYERVEVTDGRLEIHPDVYGLGGGALKERAMQALLAAGHDPTELDGSAVTDLVRQAGAGGASAPVESLTIQLKGEPAPADAR